MLRSSGLCGASCVGLGEDYKVLEDSRVSWKNKVLGLVGVGRSRPSRLHGPMLEAVDKEGGATHSPFSCSPPAPRQYAALPQGGRRMPLLGPRFRLPAAPHQGSRMGSVEGIGLGQSHLGSTAQPLRVRFPPCLPPHSVLSKVRYYSLPVTPTTCPVDGGGNGIIIFLK